MKPVLIIQRGYPGSGKTTNARAYVDTAPDERARVNRDDLRASLYGSEGVLPYAQEQVVSLVEEAQVRALIGAGKSVIVDDLNLRLRYARRWVDLAVELGVDWQVIDIATPVDKCVTWDLARHEMGGRHVGEKVIRDLAAKFPLGRWPEPRPTETAKRAWTPYEPPTGPGFHEAIYLVDIDGTLAKKRQGDGERGWHEYDRVGEDLPNPGVIRLVNNLNGCGRIIFMSGRKEHCREQTRLWLKEHVGSWAYYAALFMRADDDNRSDDIVKHELFHEHINGRYEVDGVIDDRDRVVAMWRAIGLTVAQVDYGNF